MFTAQMLAHDLEGLSREIHRLIGASLSDEHLRDLLQLNPLNTQSLSRFFQAKTRVQLKKGQSGPIVQALDRARGRVAAALPPPRASRACAGDTDLPALATPRGRALATVLRKVLQDVHFDQVNRDLRLPRYGGDYGIRPFPLPGSPVDKHEMKVRLRGAVKASRNTGDAVLARRIQQAFSFFMFGQALTEHALEELFGEAGTGAIDDAVALGLFVNTEGRSVRMNELSLFSRTLHNGDVVHAFADTPPHFETRATQQRVYAGADSYELTDRISALEHPSGYCVEMGSGSGIQLIAVLKQYGAITNAIGQERDRRAVNVSLFNAALNGVEDRLGVVSDDEGMRRALDGHPISFAMINPPFIAMPAWIDIDAEDRQSLSGLIDVRETEQGCQGNLRTVFPASGWGGDDGLEVTREFVEALVPLLAEESRTVIYSQFAGDAEGPRVLEDFIETRGGFHFAFHSVESRTLAVKQPETGRVVEGPSQKVFSAAEIAVSVARLIMAALMARQEPRRLRVSIKTGGPEHVLMMKYAGRIEESYRRQGITHFHDGFAVLTRQRATIAPARLPSPIL